jgi:phosphopantothenoylcysteine decarboxylase/phosphopantothenate--cysteine ligase
VDIETAAQLADEVRRLWPRADELWMAAAVADFRPERPSSVKLSKRAGPPRVRWTPTEDVLASAGRAKKTRQVLIGFAAETGAAAAKARAKLREKNLDFIVANDVARPGVGFDHETNAVTLIGRKGAPVELALASKAEIADRLVDLVHAAAVRSTTGRKRPGTTRARPRIAAAARPRALTAAKKSIGARSGARRRPARTAARRGRRPR